MNQPRDLGEEEWEADGVPEWESIRIPEPAEPERAPVPVPVPRAAAWRIPDPDGSIALAMFGPDHRFQCRLCGRRFGTMFCPACGRHPYGQGTGQDDAVRMKPPCGDDCPECVTARVRYLHRPEAPAMP